MNAIYVKDPVGNLPPYCTMVIAVSRAKRLTSMPTSRSSVATISGGLSLYR